MDFKSQSSHPAGTSQSPEDCFKKYRFRGPLCQDLVQYTWESDGNVLYLKRPQLEIAEKGREVKEKRKDISN